MAINLRFMKRLMHVLNGRIFIGIVSAFLVLVSCAANAQSKDTIRVLFVGNSYTFRWNLPQCVNAIAASQHQVIITRQSTVGGAFWKEHWEGKKGKTVLKTKEKIQNGNWNIVVLQNNSMSAIERPADFMKYGKEFIHLVEEKGARPLLYITWAREYNPLMQDKITNLYERLAQETKTSFAPVGPIWEKARQLRPDLPLYFADGSHPSPLGTYLIANVFYHVITGRSTATVPTSVTTTDKDGEKLYLLTVTKENADFIHELIDHYFSQESQKDQG